MSDVVEKLLEVITEEAAAAFKPLYAEILSLRQRLEKAEATLGNKTAVVDYLAGGDDSDLARCRASEAYMSNALDRELELHEQTRKQLEAANARADAMHEALAFYADPFQYQVERGFVPNSDEWTAVPDFYDELNFGETAAAAIRAMPKEG